MGSRGSRYLLFAGAFLAATTLATPSARADSDDPSALEAREAFVAGTRLVDQAKWPEALAQFELAQQRKPHPITHYNIAACQRAIGEYTAARRSYAQTLDESAHGGEGEALGARTTEEIRGLLAELDRIIATLDVTLSPIPASVSVDGAPIELERPDAAVAGLRSPGPGELVTVKHFTIKVNPGVRTLTVRGEGFADAVVTASVSPGAIRVVTLERDRLPSTLRIASVPKESVVRVDDLDVGTAPIAIDRAPGVHRVQVLHPGFVPYETQVTTHPGEDLRIVGTLRPESISLTKKWWFWTGLATVVVGVALGSYFIVRATETPERAPYNGGTLGWTVPSF